jgi:hypothetical protein
VCTAPQCDDGESCTIDQLGIFGCAHLSVPLDGTTCDSAAGTSDGLCIDGHCAQLCATVTDCTAPPLIECAQNTCVDGFCASLSPAPDGTPCQAGTCQAGTCVPQ